MLAMKRLGLLFLGAVLAAVLTSAVGVSTSHGQLALASKVASAGKDIALEGAGGHVCVAIPILTGQQNKLTKTAACPQGEVPNTSANGGAIIFYLTQILILLNGLVGAVIVLVLVIAGIQFITSAGDPSRYKAAKTRVQQAITALVLYMFMFAILNFLVPGGIL